MEIEYGDPDVLKSLGGGWSSSVVFDCEDACGVSMLWNYLVMDYWCNWSKCWTEVYVVEDKTPPNVARDVDPGD